MAAILNTKRKAPLFHPLLYFKPTNLFLEIRHFDWPQLSVSFNVQDIDGGRALVLKKVSSFAVPFQASYFTSPLS